MTEVSVYRLYDDRRILLYVGVTARKTTRQSEHADSQEWWPKVVFQEFTHYPSRDAALAAESEAIREERPVFNRAGAVGGDERRALYRLGRTDVIHAAQLKAKRPALQIARREPGGPYGAPPNLPAWLVADALAEGVVVLTESMRAKLEKFVGGPMPLDDVVVSIRCEKKVIPASIQRALMAQLRVDGPVAQWVDERLGRYLDAGK